jgi:hypothetical protein
MDSEFENIWKEVVMALLEVPSQNLSEGSDKTNETSSG